MTHRYRELDGYAEFVTGTQGTPLGLDVTTPNVARMYDYYLGGKDNFEPDRIAAEKVLALVPGLRRAAAIPKETELMAARRTGREPARRAITSPAPKKRRAWCAVMNST